MILKYFLIKREIRITLESVEVNAWNITKCVVLARNKFSKMKNASK